MRAVFTHEDLDMEAGLPMAESRARARYANGLTSVTEVAEAQRLLAQAEADDAIARLGLWRALLAVTQAQGDLTPFLERLREP